MEKKRFEEPEMEVVRFNALESVIATSGGGCSNECGTDLDQEGEFIPF